MPTEQDHSSAALGSAFHAALLLTGNMRSAERAVLSAIESLAPDDCAADACLLPTIGNSIRHSRSSVSQTDIGVADVWPELPIEMRRVMQLQATLRHPFVLRVLLGFSVEQAACLLRIELFEVSARTSEAIERLAYSPRLSTGRLSTFSIATERDAITTV